MKTTTSTCRAPYTVKCANCSRWVKEGSPIVTTVMPGLVTVAHAECPLREPFSALSRERWAEDHWDYVEQKGAE